MAKLNFCTRGLALLALTLFIGDACSDPSQRHFSLTSRSAINDRETRLKEAEDKKISEAINEITTPGEQLTDVSINYFIQIVNENYNGKFEMLDICLYETPQFYKDFAKNDTDDVQILYGGVDKDIQDNIPKDVEMVGHYICIFYKHSEQKVYIYDSLFTKKLTDTQHQIIKNLYPLAKSVRYVKLKSLQKDTSSCGVFSIAYATTLILGENPKTKIFPLDKKAKDRSMPLREHIKEMFITKTLIPFPA